jgi:8-oxo-dGTP pyrophosphatase MutT (NUDIX family)
MSWKKLSSKVRYSNRYMTVTDDEVVTDHGDKVTYGIVHKEPFVIIIPWENHQTTIVGQYRYAVDYFSWEFPMGHYETQHGSTEAAAKAELKEETGLSASGLQEIGQFYLGAGHHTQKGYIYVATGLTQGSRELETSELGMQIKTVSLPELNKLISDGTIKDGPTITALKYFELYLSTQV